jgi:hypothetical protein
MTGGKSDGLGASDVGPCKRPGGVIGLAEWLMVGLTMNSGVQQKFGNHLDLVIPSQSRRVAKTRPCFQLGSRPTLRHFHGRLGCQQVRVLTSNEQGLGLNLVVQSP